MNESFRGWRRKRLLFSILVAYAITWIGGWHFHRQEISIEAQRLYDRAMARNVESKDTGGYEIELRRGGPQHGVDWCIPILPGVLLADSFYAVGPIYGKGGVKFVLFYGFGTVTLLETFCWVS